MRDLPLHNVSLWMFAMWLVILAIVFIPPSDPPSAPAGVGIVRGFPIHAVPAAAVTVAPEIVEVPNDQPLSTTAHCPVSRSAVTEQGVGE